MFLLQLFKSGYVHFNFQDVKLNFVLHTKYQTKPVTESASSYFLSFFKRTHNSGLYFTVYAAHMYYVHARSSGR
jgi:hypothetical protein